MRYCIILMPFYSTSIPWTTSWINVQLIHKKYTETKPNSISQRHYAKRSSLQPSHLPCNICYSLRAAQGSHRGVTAGDEDLALYVWVQFWKEEKQSPSKMWVWANSFKALPITTACNKVQAEEFAARMFKRYLTFQCTSITITLQISLC